MGKRRAVRCFLGLGSNLGDRRLRIEAAIARLRAEAQIEVMRVSTFIETAPVGGPPQGDFLNGVVEIKTTLSPQELLARLQAIETSLDRVRAERWGPRTIDLDILLYGRRIVVGPDLTIPHPLMHKRRFVLEPLAEIAPEARHPVMGKTVAELLAGLPQAPRQS